MRYISIVLFAFTTSYTISFAQPRYSVDPNKPWVAECQQRAEKRVKNHESNVDKVIILGDSLLQSKASDMEKRLEGSGKYLKESGKWKGFIFECIYDTYKEEVTKVSYDNTGSSLSEQNADILPAKSYGECKLWNTKQDSLDMKGSCNVMHKKTSDGHQYVITFHNGKEFLFLQKGSAYKVRMPKEWADNPGSIRQMGKDTIFEWAKWKLVFIQ